MSRFYVWRKDEGLVEVGAARRGAARLELSLDSQYDGLRATDGTDISTRRRWKAYAKANNLTHMSDFKNEWVAAEKERRTFAAGGDFDTKRRKAAVVKAYKMVRGGYKPPPRESADCGPSGDPYPVVESFLIDRSPNRQE